jgi:hypothetical protein
MIFPACLNHFSSLFPSGLDFFPGIELRKCIKFSAMEITAVGK